MHLEIKRIPSTASFHTSNQSVAGPNCRGVSDASRCTNTCNVVIVGDTGAGKSSLVNLITGTQTAPTSPDAKGCTTDTIVYEHDIVTQDKILKVQLFDTAGLDEGSQGTVPNAQARKALNSLFQTLMKKKAIHILVYCVQGTKDVRTLQRNYKLLHPKVKGKVPIVLVVTGLETRNPDMEEWWRNNEKSISDLGMTFAGHACITAVTINEGDTSELKQRRQQSYQAVCNLIEHFRSQNGTGVRRVTAIHPVRKEHKNIVLFGASGVGKSSVVNLMAGMKVAATSASMNRCTMRWQEYTIGFGGESYKVFDTVGLEEPQLGIKEYLDSVENAYALVKELDRQGGIDLLLFCIRAGRMTATLQSNYRLFHEFLCEKKVPIVLAITNLEREQRMEDWWDQEHKNLQRHEIHVAGHACITAADGLPAGPQGDRYEESRLKIRELVKRFTAHGQQQAWSGGDTLFVSLMRKLKKLLVGGSRMKSKDLVLHLTKRCGISNEVAKQLADMIKQDPS
ncbi:P-loop containing nucleoside triphosphate hydrolase protein [Suillus spraguei]|nr:P-loop containing nucleoside triphosphate hydrolase protein [Suillus spraguei]